MKPIDPHEATKKALIVWVCIVCAIFVLVWASLANAFTFVVANNLDSKVICALYQKDHQLDYPGPIPRYTGEVEPQSSFGLEGQFEPGSYFVFWRDAEDAWETRAEFEIPQETIPKHRVTVSIDAYPLKITILKPDS